MTVSWNFPTRWGALLICKGTTNTNLKTWKVIKDAEKVIQVTEADISRLKIQHNGDMTWDLKEGLVEQKYELDEQFLKYLREKLMSVLIFKECNR